MISNLADVSLGSLLLSCGGLLVLYVIGQYALDPLRRIPGPFFARFTRLWYFVEIYKGTFERTNIALHKRYGPVVRIAPNEYSIDDPEAVKTVYGLGGNFVKAPWYASWMPPFTESANLFADQDPHRHASQRRKFAAHYSMSSLVGYEGLVDECMDLLSQRFSEIANSSQDTDLARWLQCYAFDVIGDITFAKRFGFLDMGEDKEGVFRAIDTRLVYSTFTGVFPWLHRMIFQFLPKTGGYAYLLAYTQRQVEIRQRELKNPIQGGQDGPPDIMTKLLATHEANPDKMSRLDIFTICQSNISAGSDTTSISLSSVFYHLLKYPATMSRLQEEVDIAAKEGRVSDPITFKEAQDLPYLQAVIKEALRMHPATGLGLQRIVPRSGTSISGYQFPAGATVGINAWVAHQNTSVFGPDASTWRPERWLEYEAQGRTAEVDKYFLAFGSGSRTCIGKNISLLEMTKLVPQIVRRFDLVLGDELQQREWTTENRWFVKQLDFWVRIYERRKV
ncbi:cytochrome p450 pisatin [Phlyctema vagabunda]|uniref:Cytochrome p450 pisatin n=1 Tax=Phlyctema vagabunda TaxID=108571 RepID=A0ABR4P6E6_9HELO